MIKTTRFRKACAALALALAGLLPLAASADLLDTTLTTGTTATGGTTAASACLPTAAAPTVNLIAPDGGQKLEPGSVYSVTWSASGASAVRLSLSLDGGQSYPLPLSEVASGITYAWTVPDYDSQTSRLRAEALDSCGQAVASDASQSDFAILGSQAWQQPGQGTASSAEPTVAVSVSTPVSGDSVTGTVLMQATTDLAADSLTFSLLASGAATPVAVEAISDSQQLTWTGFWDSTAVGNGPYQLTATAFQSGTSVGQSDPIDLAVANLVLPAIKVAVTDPQSGSGVMGLLQLVALTDLEADALDFVVRPRSTDLAAEPAVAYGITGSSRLLWTTVFDTRKYANGAYLIKAKAYLSGTVVGESKEIEVLFDNPAVSSVGVTVLAPANGSTATGSIALSAQTSVKAQALDFVITADDSAGGEAEPAIVKALPDLEGRKWTAIWESYDVDNGSYGLKAKAYQNDTLAGESPIQALTVYNELILVGVDLISPQHDQTVSGDLVLQVRVGEAVEKVDFLIKALDAPDSAPPTVLSAGPSQGNLDWSASWNTRPELDGRYRVSARAWYRGRSVGESAAATIHVSNVQTGATATAGLTLAESQASETDPNQTGEYSSQSALTESPTVNLDKDLLDPEASGLLLPPGTLFKSPLAPAVYYYGRDGRRYVFPDSKTYFTWYSSFANVKTVSAATVASIQLGGNVTYRPGSRMVKITSDPKVYAVARGGTLRWVRNEIVARRLYGTNWNKMIDDVSDAFFFNYRLGDPINE